MRFASRAAALAGSLLVDLQSQLAARTTVAPAQAASAPASPAAGPTRLGGHRLRLARRRLSGELTVWAMGNEGTKLGTLADAFMAENPDVKVSVTPVDWGQAVTKLQTAIAGEDARTSARWART